MDVGFVKNVGFVKKDLKEEARRLRNMGELERDLEKIFTPKYFIPPETRAKFYDFLADVIDIISKYSEKYSEMRMNFRMLTLEINESMYVMLSDDGNVEIHMPEYSHRVMAILGLVLLSAKKHYPYVDVFIHRIYAIPPDTLDALLKGGFKKINYYTMHKRFVFN